MVLNKKYLADNNLTVFDWMIFHLLFMNTSEDMTEELVDYLSPDRLEDYTIAMYVTTVKAKKKTDPMYKSLRLSKKGKEIYRNTQILEFTKEDAGLFNYVSEMYQAIGKPIGNDIRVKQQLAWFRAETQYSRRMIFKAIKTFIGVMEDNGKVKYIPSLENLLWKAPSVFSTKWTLGDSKLYQFIQEHKRELNGNTTN